MARARRIACYWAIHGEIDCGPIAAEAWERGRDIFLPVLRSGGLAFAPWRPGCSMAANRYGIPEPCDATGMLTAGQIDVVLAPLVAFDSTGTRLGMGGGYYDRSLRLLARRRHWSRPRYIGLAHAFQHVDHLDKRAWDVPLHAVVTECGVFRFHVQRTK